MPGISRTNLVLLTEFGGKGDRWVTIAEGRRQKAVSRKRESASNKLIIVVI